MVIRFSSSLFSKTNVAFCNRLARNFLKRTCCSDIVENDTKKKYNYLLVLDFEATCDKIKMEQEIIEFPCLKINMETMKEEGRFHEYVKPTLNPVLTIFCTELTGIVQEMVDNEKVFSEVFKSFETWRQNEGLTVDNSIYVTSGDWDLGHMLPVQCQMLDIPIPRHMMEWIDVKKLYGNNFNNYCGSLIDILKAFDLEFEGRPHSGIDDCLNIANILRKLNTLGIKFTPTSKLEFTNTGRRVHVYGSRKYTMPKNYQIR